MGLSSSSSSQPPPNPRPADQEGATRLEPESKVQPPDETYLYLKAFKLVWFDPSVNSSENKEYQEDFDQLFGKCEYCTTPEQTSQAISTGELIIVSVSCGSKYELVRKIVEESGRVSAIYIFCGEVALNEKYIGGKVLGVLDSFEGLKEGLKKVHHNCARTARFFEARQQRTFYTLDDSKTIKEALTIDTGSEKYSVFFPIGFDGIRTETILTDAILDEIVKVAYEDPQMVPFVPDIRRTLETLKHERNKQGIIRSYTSDGLYTIFNQYVRYGHYMGLRLFREYLFCLKGSLIELGKPMVSTTTVHRGMALGKEDVKHWIDNEGKLALFSAFTSTSLSKEATETFVQQNQGPGKARVLVSIQLTDDVKEFSDYLSKFAFVEDCGVFYPTNITEYSTYPDEVEVLFPPFYPFKIMQVRELIKDKSYQISLTAPTHVCISTNKGFRNKIHGYDYGIIKEEYNKKACELVAKGLSDDFIFCKKDVLKHGQLPLVLAALKSGHPIRRFALEFEEAKLRPKDVDEILSVLTEIHAGTLSQLSFCDCYLPIDYMVGALPKKISLFKTLTVLDLTDIMIGSKGAAAFVPTIKSLVTLTMLKIGGNDIRAEGAIVLAPAIKELKALSILTLCHNDIGPEGAAALAPALKELKHIAKLDLNNNNIQTKGISSLAPAIKKLKLLVTLNISNNDIQADGATALAPAIRKLKSLTKLSMHHNNIREWGVAALVPAIKELKHLTKLYISNNDIKSKGTVELAKAIKELGSLSKLYVNNNDMGTNGAVAIASAIKELKTLTKLHIDHNSIREEGAIAIADALKNHTLMTKLCINNNNIGVKGGVALASTIKELKLLTTLKIHSNNMREEGAAVLLPAIKELKFLTELFIANNGFDPKAEDEIMSYVKAKKQCLLSANGQH